MPPGTGTGLDITSEECKYILEVLADLRKEWTNTEYLKIGGKDKAMYTLPTKSLVLEGVYFHDPDFLPLLVREMQDLRHIEIQYNGTPCMLRALSTHCRHLESLCFLEPQMEVSVLEKDILNILFGVPSIYGNRTPFGILDRFAEEKEFREKFVVQFPNLRKLDIDELYFEEELLHDVYTLALILQPKISSFGKHTGLTRHIIAKYRRLWTIVNESSFSNVSVYLTKAKFVDSISDVPGDTELDLKYIEEVLPMFKTLKSVELLKSNWNENHVAKFCQLLGNHVDAISLIDWPVNEVSCLSNISHLRLTFMRQYSFDQVHQVLDNCPNLQTLSMHAMFQEHSRVNHDRGDELQQFGQMMDEDQRFFENLIVEELIQYPELQIIVIGANQHPPRDMLGNPVNVQGGIQGARPPSRYDRISKPKFKIHHKLTTLRIASLFEAPREPSEAFLLSLLERVPNLRNLCMGMWMGSLSHRRENLTCTGNALVSVATDQTRIDPVLTQLEQLCCLPSGTEQEMCLSLARLAKALPSLRTIVVPALDKFLLSPTLRYFQHSNIEVQHKCATDQVFSHWEPEH
ncbi:hypothetical protein OTU49_011380 [Cherax quadricarinatus]|nr:uncharacterized protein LOC128703788 isoform X2 [Cherax quadricarinatus]